MIEIEKQKFADAMAIVSSAGMAPGIPLILTTSSTAPELHLSSFDRQVLFTVVLTGKPLEASEGCTVMIPMEAVAPIAHDIPGDRVRIDVNAVSKHVHLTSWKGEQQLFKLMVGSGDFPVGELPVLGLSDSAYVSAVPFAKAIRRVSMAVARNSPVAHRTLTSTQGIHVVITQQPDGGRHVMLEATDGYIYIREEYVDRVTVPARPEAFDDLDLMVPFKAISEVAKGILGSGLTTRASQESERLLYVNRDGIKVGFDLPKVTDTDRFITINAYMLKAWDLAEKLEAVTPKNLLSEIVVPTLDLQNALRVAFNFSDKVLVGEDREVQVSAHDGALVVSGESYSRKGAVRIPGFQGGSAIAYPVPVYGRRCTDLLSVFPTSQAVIRFDSFEPGVDTKPLLLVPVQDDKQTSTFFAMMMPVKEPAKDIQPIETREYKSIQEVNVAIT